MEAKSTHDVVEDLKKSIQIDCLALQVEPIDMTQIETLQVYINILDFYFLNDSIFLGTNQRTGGCQVARRSDPSWRNKRSAGSPLQNPQL